MEIISEVLRTWKSKGKWQWVCRNQGQGPHIFMRSKHAAPPPCHQAVPIDLGFRINYCQQGVWSACRRAKSAWAKKQWTNLTGLVRNALKQLRTGPWRAVQADKDG